MLQIHINELIEHNETEQQNKRSAQRTSVFCSFSVSKELQSEVGLGNEPGVSGTQEKEEEGNKNTPVKCAMGNLKTILLEKSGYNA
jgi:hypothetical protein